MFNREACRKGGLVTASLHDMSAIGKLGGRPRTLTYSEICAKGRSQNLTIGGNSQSALRDNQYSVVGNFRQMKKLCLAHIKNNLGGA